MVCVRSGRTTDRICACAGLARIGRSHLPPSPDIHPHEPRICGRKEDRRKDDQTCDTCPDTVERINERHLPACRDDSGHSLVTLLRREKRDHIGDGSFLLGIRRQFFLVISQRFTPYRCLLPGIVKLDERFTSRSGDIHFHGSHFDLLGTLRRRACDGAANHHPEHWEERRDGKEDYEGEDQRVAALPDNRRERQGDGEPRAQEEERDRPEEQDGDNLARRRHDREHEEKAGGESKDKPHDDGQGGGAPKRLADDDFVPVDRVGEEGFERSGLLFAGDQIEPGCNREQCPERHRGPGHGIEDEQDRGPFRHIKPPGPEFLQVPILVGHLQRVVVRGQCVIVAPKPLTRADHGDDEIQGEDQEKPPAREEVGELFCGDSEAAFYGQCCSLQNIRI